MVKIKNPKTKQIHLPLISSCLIALFMLISKERENIEILFKSKYVGEFHRRPTILVHHFFARSGLPIGNKHG